MLRLRLQALTPEDIIMQTLRSAPHASRLALAALCALGVAASGTASAQDSRAAGGLRGDWPGTGIAVVVDEGQAEPRSMGSYAVRLYAARSGGGTWDAYLTGLVRPRDGTLLKLDFADLDADGSAELLVITQSAGSGGYLAADAFRLRHGVLSRVAGVEGLAPAADPVAALRRAASR